MTCTTITATDATLGSLAVSLVAQKTQLTIDDAIAIALKTQSGMFEEVEIVNDTDPNDDPVEMMLEDVTFLVPVAVPVGDLAAFIVHPDSNIQSVTDLVTAYQSDMNGFTIGGCLAPEAID
mgnify:CR=1 FL=1